MLLGVLTLLPAAVEDSGAGAPPSRARSPPSTGWPSSSASGVVGRLSRRLAPVPADRAGSAPRPRWWRAGVLALSRSPPWPSGVTLLLGLAWTAMHSSLQTWATEILPGARAAVVSLFAGSLFLGSSLAAVAVAGLADAGDYRTIFVLSALAAVPLGLSAVWGRARWRRPA